MSSSNSGGRKIEVGSSLPVILGVVFIVLKLTGVIGWPWIWVLAPFWLGFAFTLVAFVVVLTIAGIKG